MATFAETYNLRSGPDGEALKARVAACIAKLSVAILAEDAQTANHTERLAWAKYALLDPTVPAQAMMWAVLSNGTIQEQGNAATDNDVEWVVNFFLNTFAVAGV